MKRDAKTAVGRARVALRFARYLDVPFLKKRRYAKGAAGALLQSLQWHRETKLGSPVHATLSCPQTHVAILLLM
jgi:hypothetical protein